MLIEKLATLTGIAVVGLFLASPASALTMAECSTKYQAAKSAGTLNGETWNQFRKAECGSDTSAAADTSTSKKAAKASTAVDDSAGKGLSSKECSAKYKAAKAAGTLNGMKWNDFRKSECGAGASAAADTGTMKATKAATSDSSVKGLTRSECSSKYQAAK
jgi:hypothetical protein